MLAQSSLGLAKACMATLQASRAAFVGRSQLAALLHTNAQLRQEKKEAESKTESAETEDLKAEIEKLKESVNDFKDKYTRSLAEAENVRFRMRKQVDDAKAFGIQSFCKDLLSVADIMKMAVASIPQEKLDAQTDTVWKQFHEGVVMTNKELHTVFERHGLTVMAPVIGDKFDPNAHEALFEVPSAELDPGMIAYIEQNGYELKGRTLRAVRVGVSKKM